MTRTRSLRRGLKATVTTAAVVAVVAVPSSWTSATAGPDGPGDAPPAADPALSVRAPASVEYTTYGRRPVQAVPFSARLVAGAEPFVVHSNRTSYRDPVRTVWKGPGGDVEIPGAMTAFGPLRSMLRVTVYEAGTDDVVMTGRRAACLANRGERVRPDAPAYSPFPRTECYMNPYGLGQVQAIQAGWASPVLGYESPLRLGPGRYRVEVHLTRPYAAAIGVDPAETGSVTRLRVKHLAEYPDEWKGGAQSEPRHRSASPVPAAHAPAGPAGAPATGPRPDLRSLPAWGISLSANGRYLRFAATVWNAGDSPLVVDGFRRDGEDEMDAYQYFFDGDGNQTSYEPVGELHWDQRPSHSHWHFKDFATYTLLDASKQLVRTSGKEAFCLANTDSVDLTVPNAAWDGYNEDLETSCGEESSLSVREVLAAGWGDTYSQIRAGQSFNVSTLPDGVYYVAVTANPDNRLVESSLANNRSLRKIVLGTRAGQRTLRVSTVGMVVEPEGYWEE